MLARAGADAVVLLHLGFIVFAIFGGLLVLRHRAWLFLHLPALAWGLWIELSHGICPLTGLENSLRHAAGGAGYPGGFIEHYLLALIYPRGLEAGTQLALAALLAIGNLLIYARVWRRWRLSRRPP